MTKFALLFGFLGLTAVAAQPAQPRRPAPPAVAAAVAPQAVAPQVYAFSPQTSEAPARGYLGIGVTEITPESAKKLKLPEVRGVEITRVEEDSPAAKAGLKQDDVVLEYNGQRVEGTEQLTRMVRETPPGRQAKLLISRNGATQVLTVTTGQARQWPAVMGGITTVPGGAPADRNLQRQLEDMQQRMRQYRMPDVPEPFMSWRSSTLGLEGEALTAQLASYFGVGKGVLVRSVVQGSPAEKAGIKAGDVIVKVDGVDVSTPAQLSARIRQLGQRQTFPVTLVRNRQDTTLSVTIDDTAPGGGRRIRSSRPPIQAPRLIRVRPARPAWV